MSEFNAARKSIKFFEKGQLLKERKEESRNNSAGLDSSNKENVPPVPKLRLESLNHQIEDDETILHTPNASNTKPMSTYCESPDLKRIKAKRVELINLKPCSFGTSPREPVRPESNLKSEYLRSIHGADTSRLRGGETERRGECVECGCMPPRTESTENLRME